MFVFFIPALLPEQIFVTEAVSRVDTVATRLSASRCARALSADSPRLQPSHLGVGSEPGCQPSHRGALALGQARGTAQAGAANEVVGALAARRAASAVGVRLQRRIVSWGSGNNEF